MIHESHLFREHGAGRDVETRRRWRSSRDCEPTPGCRRHLPRSSRCGSAGIAFSRQGATGAERVALAVPAYKQHNPRFVKGGREAGLSDYDYFSRALAVRRSGAGWSPPAQAGPTRRKATR